MVLGREVRRTKLPVSFIVKNPGSQGILSQSAKAIHIPYTHLLFTLWALLYPNAKMNENQ